MKRLLFVLFIFCSLAAMGAGRLFFALQPPYIVTTTTPIGTTSDTSYFVRFSIGFNRNDNAALGFELYDSLGNVNRNGTIMISMDAVRKFAADSIIIDTLNTVTQPRGFDLLSQQP